MKLGIFLGGLAGLAVAMPVAAGELPAGKGVITFNAAVRVEVSAAGAPVKVEAPVEFPEVVRHFIEKRVASWQYQPAMQDGVPAMAVTYVRVGVCALPIDAGYRMGLDFKGNGPAIVGSTSWLLPPRYPKELMMAGVEGVFQVNYSIQADGSARLDEIEAQSGVSRAHLKQFRSALTAWVEGFRYRPESVNGISIATKMSVPVSFSLSGEAHQKFLAKQEAKALASNECMAAAAPAGLMPVAQNSPVKVTPLPAG